MDFNFPDDAVMLRDMLRRFVQKEAQPLEMKYFTDGALAPEEIGRLRRSIEQLGLWGLMLPECYGGGGLDLVTSCVIQEELGQTFIPVEIGEITPLLYACEGEQVTNYLEPALSGERHPILAAREVGKVRPEEWTATASPIEGESGCYFLNGRKTISTTPGNSDFFIIFAHTTGVPTRRGLTAFLLDADHPGLCVSNNGAIGLIIHDCQVSARAVLGKPGEALSIASEEAPRAWIQTGARYIGIVQRLLDMSVTYARDWVVLDAPLAIRPAIQRMIAEMSAELESSRWLVYHAAWLIDRDGIAPSRLQAMQVRLVTGDLLNRAIDRVTMIFAGPGPSSPIDPQRLARSAVPYEALELSLEYARAAISSEVLGLKHFGGDT
jgi:alkylation response protein AidB-like acyl-CoA dehydrogenase